MYSSMRVTCVSYSGQYNQPARVCSVRSGAFFQCLDRLNTMLFGTVTLLMLGAALLIAA